MYWIWTTRFVGYKKIDKTLTHTERIEIIDGSFENIFKLSPFTAVTFAYVLVNIGLYFKIQCYIQIQYNTTVKTIKNDKPIIALQKNFNNTVYNVAAVSFYFLVDSSTLSLTCKQKKTNTKLQKYITIN